MKEEHKKICSANKELERFKKIESSRKEAVEERERK
jgi:hypothetical protein